MSLRAHRSRRRRGVTLVEVIFTMSLTVVVVATATLTYGMAMTGTYDASAMADLSLEAQLAGSRFDALISESIGASAQTVNGKPALKLIMPASKASTDPLGLTPRYAANSVHPRLRPVYDEGNRIWIFWLSAATAGGGNYVIAERSDDATPTTADIDWNQSFLDGTGKKQARYPLAMGMTFSVDTSTRTVTTTMALRGSTTSRGTNADSSDDTSRLLSTTRYCRYRRAAP